MPKNIIIVESPSKAKTIEKFLSQEFEVLACGGHIRDLPEKRIGVDIKDNFTPTFAILKGKKPVVDSLKKSVAAADRVLLATDPDREGEAICWHLSQLFGFNPEAVNRIEFNEITKKAVQNAVLNPRQVDIHLVDAQLARRILDRLVGYKLSPLLWKKIRSGLSAGRVQSVALRIIIEREEEISRFKSQEYWTIEVDLFPRKLGQKKENIFRAELVGEKIGEKTVPKKISIDSETAAGDLVAKLKGQNFLVTGVDVRDKKRNPYPPFITSSMQQDASSKLGFNPKKTMRVAQQLYEGVSLGEERIGLITYMRTDSFRISGEALAEVRQYIADRLGKEFLPEQPNFYKSKKSSQDAHEAIRPTAAFREPEEIKKHLTLDQFKLYRLIWMRFLASQMLPAVSLQTTVNIEAGPYILKAVGSSLKFEGFLKIYRIEDPDNGDKNTLFPPLAAGDELEPVNFEPGQHFTEPPPRYTEASLIKVLEEFGIGRPSTYAPIMSTLSDRGYVEKLGKALKPTELGVIINKVLVENFPSLINVEFTARMEDDLDNIAEGRQEKNQLLKEFYSAFEIELVAANENIVKIKTDRPTDQVCEKCGKPMVIKSGRFGEFMACSGFPDCRNTRNIKKEIGVKCPDCGGEIIERKSRRGKIFFGCGNYPNCKFASWYRPLAENCASCGGILVEKRTKKAVLKECLKCKNQVVVEGSSGD